MTGERAASTAQSPVALARHMATRLRLRMLELSRTGCRDQADAPIDEIQRRQADLRDFYARYEELVDLLCTAARSGSSESLETEYQRLKAWMAENYGPVRRFVVAFLRYDPEDAEMSLKLSGRSADAFEVLIAAPSLGQLLLSDDGQAIGRITRTRDALNRYGEHLRQLAAQCAP